MAKQITHIIKRDGKIAPFDQNKITLAIRKAAKAAGADNSQMPEKVSMKIASLLRKKFPSPRLPSVEEIQDIVEHTLIETNYPKVAKAYIIYRHERSKVRENLIAQDFSKPCKNSITQIVKRNGKVILFNQEKITVAIYKAAGSLGIHDHKLSESLSNEVVWYLNQSFSPKHPPGIEEIQDIIERVLIKREHTKIAKAYILYREERTKQRRKTQQSEGDEDITPYKKLWQVLLFNSENSCDTIEKLNEQVRNENIRDLITRAENEYHEEVSEAANEILKRRDKVKFVIIAGPSSSGKTTTTIKLAEHLKTAGLNLIALNVDNYYYNLECHPQDEWGDHDFETPEALDLPLINRHLKELLTGRTVQVPRYDFKAGKRTRETDEICVKENEIILIDTLHGLYDGLTKEVPDDCKFKVYVETLNQLKDNHGQFVRWTDIRLLRRMVRDKAHRGFTPDRTIEHWHYVRRSELKHIIPYIPKANHIINGSLCYELCVLKKHAFHYFPSFIKTYEDDPKRQDAFIRAQRLFSLLNTIEEIKDESWVPRNSVLREFIGGSEYTYSI